MFLADQPALEDWAEEESFNGLEPTITLAAVAELGILAVGDALDVVAALRADNPGAYELRAPNCRLLASSEIDQIAAIIVAPKESFSKENDSLGLAAESRASPR